MTFCVQWDVKLHSLTMFALSSASSVKVYTVDTVTWPGKGSRVISPQTAVLPPKQIHLEIFLTSFATNVPQMSQFGVQTKKFSACSTCTIVLYPRFHSSGAVSDCNG